jgi:peptidoglycan/xylan/chitin deacetylase (PgdA/CDA1 family)
MIRRILVVVGVIFLSLFAALWWSYSAAIVSLPTDEKVVALTYDDGPNPPHTEALLELLAQHGVKATFFLKGRNVEAYPGTVQAILQAGHEIGNHSYSHRPMFSLSRSAMQEEVARTNALIAQVTGSPPALFRPPYGGQGPGLKRALSALGMPSILFGAVGFDWQVTDPQRVADHVLDAIEPGDLVLLHDGDGDVDDPRTQATRAHTVAATGIIIEALKAQGYRFATVGELMAISAAQRQ